MDAVRGGHGPRFPDSIGSRPVPGGDIADRCAIVGIEGNGDRDGVENGWAGRRGAEIRAGYAGSCLGDGHLVETEPCGGGCCGVQDADILAVVIICDCREEEVIGGDDVADGSYGNIPIDGVG